MIKIKEKFENLTIAKPAKAGVFYIITNAFTKLVALLATPLFTRLLLPEEYGVYSLYISWMGIVNVSVALGISGGAIYRALGKFGKDGEDVISSAIGIIFISSAVLFIPTLLFRHTVSALTGLSPLLNLMLILEVFLNCAQAVVFAFHRYKYSYVRICLINLLYALISVGVAFAIIYFTRIKAEARIYASFFASATLTLPLIRRYLKPKIPRGKEMRKYLIKLSLPLLPSALSTALIAQLDKLMIERLGGTAALGKYSIAYSVGFMLTTLTAALYSALQPWLMRKLNSGNTDAARAITEKIIFLTALGLLVFLLLIPEIFKIIAAEAYRDAEIAVYPLAAAGYLQFISNLLAANIIHTEKTLAISVSGLIAFAFNLVTNLFLIPRFSYPAAAITTAISYLILVFLEYFYLKRRSPLKIVDKETLTPLWLILFALPVYFLREIFISRFIFAIAVVLSALPTLIKFIRAFLERRGESETN